MPLPREIFLSHSHHDRKFAARIAEMLRQHGVPVWYSPSNIVGAQQWQDEIGTALNRCDWFLLVLSPNSIESMWVKREVSFALQQERMSERIIPLLYQDCEIAKLSWVLPGLQYVDYQRSFDDGCRALLRVWGLGYQPE